MKIAHPTSTKSPIRVRWWPAQLKRYATNSKVISKVALCITVFPGSLDHTTQSNASGEHTDATKHPRSKTNNPENTRNPKTHNQTSPRPRNKNTQNPKRQPTDRWSGAISCRAWIVQKDANPLSRATIITIYYAKYQKWWKREETELRYTDRGPILGDPQSVYRDVFSEQKCKRLHDLYKKLAKTASECNFS